ncbi:MAG: acyl-CoA dehydratase activase [Thermodesulfobacteriota bacterium]
MISVGIDIGSITAKAAILDGGQLKGTFFQGTGYDAKKAAAAALQKVLAISEHEQSDVDIVVATGYGRKSVSFADKTITEISCHAAGAHFANPDVRSVIDIGGQDSKAMVISPAGKVLDFAMNDKCAAGTGRFLEVMARALEIDLEQLGGISLKSNAPATISSLCTVFAESEVISLIAKGEKRENIIAGIHGSIGARVVAMAGRLGLTSPVMMTGGVAKNVGLVRMLEEKIGMPVEISEHAQVLGAIGAALIGQQGR